MKIVKQRTINELRQVKDTNHRPPLSHNKAIKKNTKDGVLYHLLRAHSSLFENYENSASNQYVLSSISQIVYLLQPNSNEKG
jgi:hypothetical protein